MIASTVNDAVHGMPLWLILTSVGFGVIAVLLRDRKPGLSDWLTVAAAFLFVTALLVGICS